MPEIKIGVSAGLQGVDGAISKITQKMNALAQAVGKSQGLKVEPTDMKTMARDLDLINRQFQKAIALSAQLRNALKASGQSGLHISQVDWSKTSTSAATAQNMRNRAFQFAVQGTSLDPTLANEVDAGGNAVAPAPAPAPGGDGRGGGVPRAPRVAPNDGEGAGKPGLVRRTIGSFGRGLGGATGGAIEAGALTESAGMAGIAAAAGPVALAYGAYKAAEAIKQFVGESMTLYKGQLESADSLKRSMGDLGVSFKGLTDDSRVYGQAVGVAGGEFLKLEEQANSASGGAYRTPEELANATLSGGSLARAYGLQPGQGVSFVSGMQRLDSRQNTKELAGSLAEAIVNAQGKATPGEVMHYMQSFASSQNRFDSVNPNLNRWGNAFGDLLNGDMTADHAASILGQANSAVQQMGGTEASKNFTLQAFGNLDPVRAAMRAEGGLFANGLDNGDIASYMSQHGVKNWEDLSKGPAGTNYGVIRDAFDKAYAGRGQYGAEMELDAEKSYFGLKSYADTAAFMKMGDSDHNGIDTVLSKAGVKLGDLNVGGLQSIAAISKATDIAGLDKLYRDGPDAIRNRSDLSDDDKARLDKAEKGGNFDDFQNALVRTLAGKGQADDDASVQRSIDANIENIKSNIGEKILPWTQTMMTGILAIANKIPGVYIDNPWADGGANFMGPAGSLKPAYVAGAAGPMGDALGISKPVAGAKDAAAAYLNTAYGAAQGGWYGTRDDVQGGMAQLMGLGVDKPHAAAIMASAIRESSMNPAAKNGNMYGLFQFDQARQADFKRVMGKDIHGASASEQIDYMVKSMQAGGEEAVPGKEFWASGAKDAAGVFARKIERTDNPSKESDIRSGIAGQLGDINITLHQTIAGQNGQSKTKVLSTKVPNPAAQGLPQNPIIVQLPR